VAPTDRVAGVPDGAEPPLPRVSVGLVVRNAEATVLAAVRSILFQTLSSWELLVANDGSTDRTAVIRCTAKPRRSSLRWSYAVSWPPSTRTGSTIRSVLVPWLSTYPIHTDARASTASRRCWGRKCGGVQSRTTSTPLAMSCR